MNRCLRIVLTLTVTVLSARAEVTEPAERYGAIAFARTNTLRTLGVSCATAVSEATEFMAKTHALRGCYERSCQIVAEVKTGCLATSRGWENPGPHDLDRYPGLNWYGFGFVRYVKSDDTTTQALMDAKLQRIRNEASVMAVTACELGSHSQCQPAKTWCTWDIATSSPEEIREWIAAMGGERSEQILAVRRALTTWTFPILVQDYSLTSWQTACLLNNRFATLQRLAVECQIGVRQLDSLLGEIDSP